METNMNKKHYMESQVHMHTWREAVIILSRGYSEGVQWVQGLFSTLNYRWGRRWPEMFSSSCLSELCQDGEEGGRAAGETTHLQHEQDMEVQSNTEEHGYIAIEEGVSSLNH